MSAGTRLEPGQKVGSGRLDVLDERIWRQAIRAVLDNPREPALLAQPIVDLDSGAVAGYEMLARFTGPPQASPDVWFAAADRLGYGPMLTSKVIRNALALRARLPTNAFLTINVEPHLLTSPIVTEMLHGHGRLDRTVIELTEHAQVNDELALRAAIDRIRSAGGLVAIDDAGTGYAGLTQIMLTRPDIVKVDRGLVSGVDSDPILRATIELLGDLVGRMDAWLLAEGVETGGELQALTTLGVPLAQGWLLARPGQGWPVLTPETANLVRQSSARSQLSGHIAALVRECTMLTVSQWNSAQAGTPGDPAARHTEPTRPTVIIDDNGRPISVVSTDPGGNPYLAVAMMVAPASTPDTVARRAMARPIAQRGVPLVCTDTAGHPIGVIDIAELVDAAIKGSG